MWLKINSFDLEINCHVFLILHVVCFNEFEDIDRWLVDMYIWVVDSMSTKCIYMWEGKVDLGAVIGFQVVFLFIFFTSEVNFKCSTWCDKLTLVWIFHVD